MSSPLAFVTHPSVRIKGTENAYTPTQCMDDLCPVKAPHLHCPFCVKSDAYQDPVILKAHYRVKHVDKGIEFAGLKILRCCDQCDIIGIIKGEKRFKGAHWHCYRCRNGFNRRDEAIKHYKTHFRNPQTTFQIQITQDLNSPPMTRTIVPEERTVVQTQDTFSSIESPVQEIIHPALSEALSLAETNVIATQAGGNLKVQNINVKHEPLDKDGGHDEQQTIMIIQGDQLESAFASHLINAGDLNVLSKANHDSNISWELRCRMEEEEKNMYKAKAQEYKAQVELLQEQVAELETQLAQQSELKLQEFINDLNSGDYLHKQTLTVQLAKFLEQMQGAHNSANSVDNLHHSDVSHSNPLGELVSSPSLTQGLDSNRTTVHEHSSRPVEISSVTHLSGIPEGYHVVSTTPEGHVIVRRTSVSSEDDVISVTADDSNNSLSHSTVSIPQPPTTVTLQGQSGQGTLIPEGLILDSFKTSPSEALMGENDEHTSEQSAMSMIGSTDNETLLHGNSTDDQTSADEGQVSLRSGDQRACLNSVVTALDNGQSTPTYVMDIGVQNRLLATVNEESVLVNEVIQASDDQNFITVQTEETQTKRIRLEI